MASNEENRKPTGLQLISPVFRDGSTIPTQYTCKGQNINPALNIFNVPDDAQSLALILHDPDAPGGDYTHWLVWDMPTSTEGIPVNSVPMGAIQGVNSAGDNKYMGPCPPAGSGVHRYIFELYALDTTLALPAETNRGQLESAMQNHILQQCALTGLFRVD